MMSMQRRLFDPLRRLTMAAVLVAVAAIAPLALAQDADPPGRVARLSEVDGQVWVYSPQAGDWIAAQRNQPLTTGDRLATENGARAELQIGSTSVRIDAASELEVLQLDDERVALQLQDGAAIARIRDPAAAGQFELSTDEGRFLALSAGTYRFDRATGRSDITVYAGQARYEGPNSALPINTGQRAEFWIDSGGVAQYSTLAPLNDGFLAWSSDRDRRLLASVSERYVSPEMTGAAELDTYGRWEQSDDYGPLWIPTAVAVDWAPYSHGHWAWVAPWGWTWIDEAPWGFAPFHYGRWVYARSHWCWTPGVRVARPVYAPALVGWVGGPRGNVSVTVGGGPAVGWFPLAPREVYVPSYRVSPRYAERINITYVGNVNVIRNVFNNPQGPRDFENRRFPRAITVVPANVMAERRPVAPAAAQLRQAPWVRDIANGPSRGAPLLAPPIAAPVIAARNPDRAVRPPPGAAERPSFNGRPGQSPASPPPAAPSVQAAQPNAGRPPGYEGAPGRIRMPMDNTADPGNARQPEQRPAIPSRTPGFREGGAAPQPAVQPAPQPIRPPAAPQASPQEGPMMRALPVHRGDERRIEERRPVPPPQPQPAQAPPPVQPRAVEQAPPPRPPAEVRPVAPVVIPPAPPQARPEARPPEQHNPRPEDPKRGEPRDQR